MKRLMTEPNLTKCDVLKAVLESSGIACAIKNEHSSRTAGVGFVGPLGFATPELWVLDDDRFEEAKEIAKGIAVGIESES